MAADEAPRSNGPRSRSSSQQLKQEPAVDVSILQPRLAVVLGVPKWWHPWLMACRLLSITPTLWWGIRCALRLLILQLFDLSPQTNQGYEASQFEQQQDGIGGLGVGRGDGGGVTFRGMGELTSPDGSLKLIETGLSIIWSWASAYLAFFFTDRLMSRWLLNYTPEATIIRLFTVCIGFAYATSWVVFLTGGSEDPSLLLPSWIAISAALTACYAYSQRKITIRKETRLSIRVFSVASFISMVSLLLHSHYTRSVAIYGGANNIPLVALGSRAGVIIRRLIVRLLGVNTD